MRQIQCFRFVGKVNRSVHDEDVDSSFPLKAAQGLLPKLARGYKQNKPGRELVPACDEVSCFASTRLCIRSHLASPATIFRRTI